MSFNLKALALQRIATLGPRYLPFADVATPEVPLSRLLRLSLFQVTVGMALVLLVGTLNRVMIVELDVPATLVAGMLALPLLFAPFRTLIGHRSDAHVSALGWRRVPYIWKGTLYQFGGFAIMPFALLVLSGYGESGDLPRWIGMAAAGLAFLLVGAGLHMVQTVGLALATDLVPDEDHPKVVGLMYVMLLFGMVASALVYGLLLENYTPGRLVQVIQGSAVVTVALNLTAMWKQEARNRDRAAAQKAAPRVTFREAWDRLVAVPGTLRLLVVIGLGTFGFGMADVLLEPYGGQALGLSVAQTTKLTALLAGGSLIGFAIASRVLSRGLAPDALARVAASIGIPGFAAIIAASQGFGTALFLTGTLTTGIGAGLFGHATLTAAIQRAPKGQIGLALGAWGAVQATCAGIGVALAGILRDVLVNLPGEEGLGVHTPYNVVFGIEILFLALAVLVALPLGARLVRRAIQS
ncbi:pucC [Dinoroseobacter shibae DFL 12 = DSM 16493]|jgi:BCD family chlorophyll transporter-like MFS transporter|uniref:PucC n=1 Tax=Dinoroseobacter shibae (strain DSM 16493 / NCIMB 14021 / DFL 12) TaxID=398580 RepID=A8LJM8_DINSH|nr:PucC family protein [Dinoroseobacter shibae]ABV94631.1 pucC [Dinoroseobacter shibae DFL 12 = DSM 16493]URF46057.1 PucC family protein [Dinoroseobacter shibae]URF50363.1 PucC family protein [Dinoroseobacter shibae]